MGKKNKKSKNETLEKFILARAVIDLIKTVIDLIKIIIEIVG